MLFPFTLVCSKTDGARRVLTPVLPTQTNHLGNKRRFLKRGYNKPLHGTLSRAKKTLNARGAGLNARAKVKFF